MIEFQRARSQQEKEVRRITLLDAARQLVSEHGPYDIGLNEIARRAGISKPNIYRYFESREDILYSIFMSEYSEFVSDLEAELGTQRSSTFIVTKCIKNQFLQRPLFCQLLGMVSSVLEHNMSEEAIIRSKREVLRLNDRLAAVLLSALFWLSPEDSVWLANTLCLYVASLWPASHPSESAAAVLQKPEFTRLARNPEKELGKFVDALLIGLKDKQ